MTEVNHSVAHGSFGAAKRQPVAVSARGLADVLVIRPREEAVVVEFTGEHDLITKDKVQRLLSRAIDQNDLVVVDISNTDFIDSSFLHNLFLADKRARERGTDLRLQIGTAAHVRRVLEISGLLRVITAAHTREDALRTVNACSATG